MWSNQITLRYDRNAQEVTTAINDMASKPRISSKVIFTPPQSIISTALERGSIGRSSEQQSKIKTENKGFTSLGANSLSHNLGKINISRSNFNVSSRNKQHNISSSLIPSQTNFNKAQAPKKLQTIRKSPIISNFRQGNTLKGNFSITSINSRIQRTSNIENPTLRRLLRNYRRNKNPGTFGRVYNFQQKNFKTLSDNDLTDIRSELVKDAADLYDKINLFKGKISYQHKDAKVKNEMGENVDAAAIAYSKDKTIEVYKAAMRGELNSFLNTVRHEGYHIGQYNANIHNLDKKLPGLKGKGKGKGKGKILNLLEFLSESREIVGGFKESLIPYSADVHRFTNNYKLLKPLDFLGNTTWYRRVAKRGKDVANAIQTRLPDLNNELVTKQQRIRTALSRADLRRRNRELLNKRSDLLRNRYIRVRNDLREVRERNRSF